MAITASNKLLTGSWTSVVEALERDLGRLAADRRVRTNDCRIVFFEIERDARLHVNVTHRHETMGVRGWAGPASLPQGFVHNRTFGGTQPNQIGRHIRDMVLAGRV